MRRAAKRDDNEALIVRALGSAGWTVVRVSDSGAPDLLCARMGELRLVEVKGPKGTLTPTQEVAFERLSKSGVTVLVVRSPQEALTVLGCARPVDHAHDAHWLAENGSFLCESCWLPENGLHAKDCPTRQALKVPGKVKSAYRAAKEAQDVVPKTRAPSEMSRDEVRWRQAANVPDDAVIQEIERRSRGVEGELQPLKVKR